MDTLSGTVSIWQSGRLAPRSLRRPFEFSREHWLACGLLVLSAVVLTMFVVVLERDVASGELQHVARHSRALAEAQCESDQPMERRGRCVARFEGNDGAVEAASADAAGDGAYQRSSDMSPAQESAARAATLSLLATR